LSDQANLEALYTERGLAGAQAPGTRPCLVVVDMVRGFTERESPLWCDCEAAVQSISKLLVACRANGHPVAFTTVAYDEAGIRIAAAFIEKVPALLRLAAGSRWVEVDPRLEPLAHEPVFTKLFASAFFGTGLASYMTAHQCDSVVVTGASTSGCVRATVVDALQNGYRVIVPRDAVADRAEAPHTANLFDIQAKYGSVVSTTEALALLQAPSR
jgi:nicotinamidase-related amidase